MPIKFPETMPRPTEAASVTPMDIKTPVLEPLNMKIKLMAIINIIKYPPTPKLVVSSFT